MSKKWHFWEFWYQFSQPESTWPQSCGYHCNWLVKTLQSHLAPCTLQSLIRPMVCFVVFAPSLRLPGKWAGRLQFYFYFIHTFSKVPWQVGRKALDCFVLFTPSLKFPVKWAGRLQLDFCIIHTFPNAPLQVGRKAPVYIVLFTSFLRFPSKLVGRLQ